MKKMSFFWVVFVVVIIASANEIFTGVYDVHPSWGTKRSQRVKKIVKLALNRKAITKEKAELIFETDKLFAVTNEQRKQICIEACKWALAKIISLANDRTIPLKVRQQYFKSVKDIKMMPGLKQAFNYDDVDFSLYKGNSWTMEKIKQGYQYGCATWVDDCLAYGYIKVKEKDLRKAAKLLGYSFEELVRKLFQCSSILRACWIKLVGRYKTKPIPPGVPVEIVISRTRKTTAKGEIEKSYGHKQISLGKFGFSSNGFYFPDVSKITYCHGKRGIEWYWSLHFYENPIVEEIAFRLN